MTFFLWQLISVQKSQSCTNKFYTHAIICSYSKFYRCQKHGGMRGLLDLSPWNYNKLNSFIPTKISRLTRKHFCEIGILKHLKAGELEWKGEEGRQKSKDWCRKCSPEITVELWERGRIRLLCALSVAPSTPAWLISIYYGRSQQSTGAETRMQKCSSCVLAATAVRQKTKPLRLATSPYPPRTHFPAPSQS